ncbi:MAG TPA: hypothetical protein VHZ78_08460 [Rhizomicrobium sp.]|jgi:hypothetical protein|nr:hypothetical protein [Rhizomicrobium sp.]
MSQPITRAVVVNPELVEYRALVARMMQEALRDRQRRVLLNKGTDHAKVVIDNMLENARGDVSVFARKLTISVFDPQVIRTLLERLPSANVRVVVSEADALSAPDSALSQLGDVIATGRIKVATNLAAHESNNVCVVDKLFTRLEKNPVTREATVVFGDPDYAQSALNYFERIWTPATKHQPEPRA